MPRVDLPAVGGWVLVAVFTMVVLDALLPFLPGETVVMAAGVAAAEQDRPWLVVPVLLATTAGVLGGDCLAYLIGSRSGPGMARRLRRGRRGAALHDWVVSTMGRHGPILLVLGRYLPGVRSVTAYTGGAVGYPIRRFVVFTLLGAVVWAVQAVLLGYLGGVAFAGRPVLGFGAAWLVAFLVSAVAVLVRRAVSSKERKVTV